MVNLYTASKRLRSDDAYTPEGRAGARPDYAVTVYTQILKKLFPDVPVVIGGIEASLRRFVHFDYWESKLLPSILESSKADLLVYGMGEKQVVEIADYLAGGATLEDMHYIRGTAYSCKEKPELEADEYVEMPSWAEIQSDRKLFAKAYHLQSQECDPFSGKTVIQKGQRRYIESLSSYARQFLGGTTKPAVDSIEGLSPSISIDQKTTNKNPRSTVGTITEIYDYLRLLFARIGVPYCPKHKVPITSQSIDEMTNKVMDMVGEKITILAPVIHGEKGTHKETIDDFCKCIV